MKSKSKDQIGGNVCCTTGKSLADKKVSLGSAGNGIGGSKTLGGAGQTGKRLK
jgi:hypothetical protein